MLQKLAISKKVRLPRQQNLTLVTEALWNNLQTPYLALCRVFNGLQQILFVGDGS